jgi:hypothetical protein
MLGTNGTAEYELQPKNYRLAAVGRAGFGLRANCGTIFWNFMRTFRRYARRP